MVVEEELPLVIGPVDELPMELAVVDEVVVVVLTAVDSPAVVEVSDSEDAVVAVVSSIESPQLTAPRPSAVPRQSASVADALLERCAAPQNGHADSLKAM